MDCLELAAGPGLDMRASPYDLAGFGFEPIAIETSAGRAEYVRAQRTSPPARQPLRAAHRRCRCDGLLVAALAAAAISPATA